MQFVRDESKPPVCLDNLDDDKYGQDKGSHFTHREELLLQLAQVSKKSIVWIDKDKSPTANSHQKSDSSFVEMYDLLDSDQKIAYAESERDAYGKKCIGHVLVSQPQ